MGNEWTCPCGERERMSRRLTTNTEPEAQERFSQLYISVKLVFPAKIQRFLKRPQGEHVISSFVKHPMQDTYLAISLLELYLNYKLVTDGCYQIFLHQFTTIEQLESEIQQKNEKGFVFLGGYCYLNKFHLVYYQSNQQIEGRIKVKVETGYNLQELKTCFAEETNCIFIGCINYMASTYLFFQQVTEPVSLQYHLAEFPASDMDDPDFEHDVSSRVHKCMTDPRVKFKGCVSNETSLYLVFIKD